MKREFTYQINGDTHTVTIEPDGDCFRVTVDKNVYGVAVKMALKGQLALEIDNRQIQAYVARHNSRHYVAMDGDTWVLERPQAQSQRRMAGPGTGASTGCLEATMPGLVLDVLVREGDEVAQGQTLVLLEAMKMELGITAPFAGRVNKVHCSSGQVVARGQILVEIE